MKLSQNRSAVGPVVLRNATNLLMCLALVAALLSVESPARARNVDEMPGESPDTAPRALRQSTANADGLLVVLDERGNLTHSIDAAGSTSASSQLVLSKPANGTLRRATMFVASTGYSGPAQGELLLDGDQVPLANGIASSISSMNYSADVTESVRAKVDLASAGPISFDVTETASASIDGVILSLIFDDPAVSVERSVTLLFGAMQTGGDRFTLRMSEPLSPQDVDSILEMSLGISFGYQSGPTGQHSVVDVNRSRLTTSAGGEDDGESANGALITVGGEADDPTNPLDPHLVPSVPTYDDELYDLRPFVNEGDESILVETSNPSNDDNLFFAAFTTNPPVSYIYKPGNEFPYKFVSLGDSFSSGEGLEPFYGDNRCHRSTLAYSHFVEIAGRPGVRVFDESLRSDIVEWGFQACAGATTKDVLQTGQWGDPIPQLQLDRADDTGNDLDLPVDEDTDLVTITIGGNDVGFSKILSFCYFSSNCTTEKYRGRSLASHLRREKDELSGELDKIYTRLETQAKSAQVLALGYPQLFPESADEQNCAKLSQKDYIVREGIVYKSKSIGFSRPEQNYLRQATSELNQLIAARAEEAPSVTFVPVNHIFAGHEICGDKGEWIHGPTLSRKFKANDQSFHPNARGHEFGYAEAINGVLNP